MSWKTIKESIEASLIERNLSQPKRRLKELENIENNLKTHFSSIYNDPTKLKEKSIKDFKKEYAKIKPGKNLSGAESSLINEIYRRLDD